MAGKCAQIVDMRVIELYNKVNKRARKCDEPVNILVNEMDVTGNIFERPKTRGGDTS